MSLVGIKGEAEDSSIGMAGGHSWLGFRGDAILVGSWRRFPLRDGEVRGPRKLVLTVPSSSLNPPVHQMKLLRLCASSPSPAHLSCPM